MARSAAISIENNASKGLITEATGLNFPENAWTDALNVVPDNKGMTRRRSGIDLEYGYTEFNEARGSSAITSTEWLSVAGNGDLTFIVVQVGDTLYFYQESATAALSAGKKTFSVDLDTFKTAGAPTVDTVACQFSSGKGFLFVTHPYCEPFYISYVASTDTITATAITIKLRDFEGVDDGLTSDNRPVTLSDAHEYNLCNQGWAEDQKNNTGTTINPIDHWFTTVADYPSNAQQWWVYKSTSEELAPASFEKSFSVGNSLAPKGHYILTWFNTDRSGADTRIGTVTERSSSYFRPNTCAFFAGRVFYAGVNYQDYVGEVYFSQIVENVGQIGKCYQQSDPTSEIFSDLIATDGGVVRILDAGTIYKLFPSQRGLLVFASNGIWSISGSETIPFKATEYTVTKISGVKVLSQSSFVDVQGFPMFWNQEGIFVVAGDPISGFKVDSVTDTSIKTFFNAIPIQSKTYARGAYDPVQKTVTWVYKSTGDATGDAIYNYDKVLVLNVLTGAFYPWTIDITKSITINGVVISKSISQGAAFELLNVVDGVGDNVVDGSLNEVVVGQLTIMSNEALNFSTKFIVTRTLGTSSYGLSFAEEYHPTHKDWYSQGDGVSFSSYFTSGYKLHTEAQRFGQANYVVIYANNLTNASALLNVIWDFGKVTGATNQLYRTNLTVPNITQSRIMLRGRGRAFQFKVSSSGDFPFEVIGWSVFETQNSSI